MINWENHKDDMVECVYMPREPLLPGQKELTGRRIKLVALWLMDNNDPYPGEWALTSSGETFAEVYSVFGRAWIASGDVVALTTSQHNTAQ